MKTNGKKKVLFIGIGLSHYNNQILNKLNLENDIEIFNLVDADGRGAVGGAVFQTREGINFKVLSLIGKYHNKFSDYRYRQFVGLGNLLKKIRPDIIVTLEQYLEDFLYDKELTDTVKKMNIKLVRKDIPLQTDKYNNAKRKILSGESDETYTPVFVAFFIGACNRLKLNKLPDLCQKILHLIKLDKIYRKFIGRKVLLKRLEIRKQILNMVDAHVNYVDEAYDIFESYGVSRSKIFITRNSPDTDILFNIRKKIEQEPTILPPSKHRLVHLSRLIPWKRVDMIIEALKNLKPEFPDAELLVIGSGPSEGPLKNLVKKLNLENSVKFLGGVYNQEILGKYLLSSNIYVLAGMGGLSINDAMTFGLPVICSVCDGTEKKLVRDGYNGLYFKEGDLLDLTEKIRYLFRNPNLLEKMGQNSVNIIKNEVNIYTVINEYKKAFDYVVGK
ncbi:MAG: glycosyltransferase family 4 protein [Candidatus Paceibacterota bacterium]|jgi:glycosyltransferase involved in cell wall biosynthesis